MSSRVIIKPGKSCELRYKNIEVLDYDLHFDIFTCAPSKVRIHSSEHFFIPSMFFGLKRVPRFEFNFKLNRTSPSKYYIYEEIPEIMGYFDSSPSFAVEKTENFDTMGEIEIAPIQVNDWPDWEKKEIRYVEPTFEEEDNTELFNFVGHVFKGSDVKGEINKILRFYFYTPQNKFVFKDILEELTAIDLISSENFKYKIVMKTIYHEILLTFDSKHIKL